IDWDAIDTWIVHAYQVQMKNYLLQRSMIPPGNLIEIRYEDLDARPMSKLEDIYKALDLGDFERMRSTFEGYLESLGTYEKNKFEFPEDVVSTVNDNWDFAFEAFGYERMSPGQSPD
ncbi:MAG: sulfotransferase, partial [Myxococcota bacterium]